MNCFSSLPGMIGSTLMELMRWGWSVQEAELLSNLSEELEDSVEVHIFMRGHVARPASLHPRRDARTDKGIHENAGVEKRTPELERDHVIADDNRNHGRLSVEDLETERLEASAHLVRIAEKPVDAPGSFKDIQRGEGCRDRRGRRTCAENERGGLVFCEVDDAPLRRRQSRRARQKSC